MKHQAAGFSGLVLHFLRRFKEELEAKIDDATRELPGSRDRILDRGHQLLEALPLHIEVLAEELEQWVTQAVLHFV
jgi:hypothetical protein